MNVYDLFPSKYVRAGDLPEKGITVTMESVTIENLHAGQGQKKTELKPVLWFRKATKGLVLNKTNAMLIADLYGPEMDGWPGNRIELYPTKVDAFGKMQDAVRVRNRRFAPQPTTPVEAVPALEAPEDMLDYDEDGAEESSANPFLDIDEVEPQQTPATTQRSAPPTPPEASVPMNGNAEAPDPVTVAVGELTGQKLGVILAWGMAHGHQSKEETRTLWDSIRANGLDGPATLVGFVRTILLPETA